MSVTDKLLTISTRNKRTKQKQFTCSCTAYKFPHRLGGGRCTLQKFVVREFEKNYGSGECSGCLCFSNYECSVANGVESPEYCQIVQNIEHFYQINLIGNS